MMNKTSPNIYIMLVLKFSHCHVLPILKDISWYPTLAIIFHIV